MPVLGFICLTCQYEQSEYSPSCPSCRGTMSAKYHEIEPLNPWEVLRRRREAGDAQRFEPIVYHITKDGHVSTPAHPDAPVRPGYERMEARTIREIQSLEKRVNRQELDKAEAHQHREEIMLANLRAETRPTFLRNVQRMSAKGRRIAEIAMERNDSNRPRLIDPGVHFEVLHFDQSNRDAHQDAATGWKARRR